MLNGLFTKKGANGSPKELVNRQRLMVLGGVVVTGLLIWLGSFFVTKPHQKRIQPQKQKLTTALDSIDPEDRWVNRVEQKAREAKTELKKMEQQSKLQEDRIQNLEKALRNIASFGPQNRQPGRKARDFSPLGAQDPFRQSGRIAKQAPSSKNEASMNRSGKVSSPNGQKAPYSKIGTPRLGGSAYIYQSSLSRLTPKIPAKNIDTYIAGGTHAKGVLISGLTAYTGVNSTSDPEPIKVRLTNYGVIAKGFKGDIKDAVIIGSCYGEISAERARCRIHSLTLEEENGEIIETPVQGWIMGEDGRSGIRGVVIDRAGEMARAAFGAGLLGGVSSFFQKQAQNSVYPVSPFGQTNALKGEDLLKSAGTAGVSSALEKLADYAIKRAEKMEPVIVVDAGRRVDVLFKEGFDLSGTQVRQELHRLGTSKRQKAAKHHAHNVGPQTGGL